VPETFEETENEIEEVSEIIDENQNEEPITSETEIFTEKYNQKL